MNTFGGFSHQWKCEYYMVTSPGDSRCQASASQTPDMANPSMSFSQINAMGKFGTWASMKCFVPNLGLSKLCYATIDPNTNKPYDPISQVGYAPLTKWYNDPNAAPTYMSDSNGQTPHWLSVCLRETTH